MGLSQEGTPAPEPLPARRWFRYRPERPAAVAAAAATCGLLLGAWAVLSGYNAAHQVAEVQVDPESTFFWGPHEINAHVLSALVPFYDSRGQRLAHMLVVAGAGLLACAAPWLAPRLGLFARPAARWAVGAAVAAAAAVLLATGLPDTPMAYYPIPPTSLKVYLAGVGLVALYCAAGRRLERGWPGRVFLLAAVGFIALATVPGFFNRLDLSMCTWEDVVFYEHHYTTVVGPGDRLGAGQRMFEQAHPHYGMIHSLLCGAFQRHARPLDMGDYIRVFGAVHALYLGLALFLYHRYSGGRRLSCLAALGLAVPWYYFTNDCMVCPNMVAWRSASFLLSLLALYLVRDRGPAAAAYSLGCVGGLALLMNVETGVAAVVGLLAYLYLRYPGLRVSRVLGLATLFPAGVATAALAFAAACRVGLGYWPDVRAAAGLADMMMLVSRSGFGGCRFTGGLLPTVIFFHAAFVLIYSSLRARGGDFRHAFRACVAAILVVWSAHYANRPSGSYLPPYCVLYGFLFIDLLRQLAVAARTRTVNGAAVLAFAVAALVVVPGIIRVNRYFFPFRDEPNLYHAFRPDRGADGPPGSALVCGVYLPGKAAAHLREKAAFVRDLAAGGRPPLYLTKHSFLVPKLAGVYPPMPYGDVFGEETLTKAQYDRLVDFLLRSEAEVLLFDAPVPPGTGPAAAAVDRFYDRLRADVSGRYRKDGESHGWEVWRRR